MVWYFGTPGIRWSTSQYNSPRASSESKLAPVLVSYEVNEAGFTRCVDQTERIQ